jgi:hypothetical protein
LRVGGDVPGAVQIDEDVDEVLGLGQGRLGRVVVAGEIRELARQPSGGDLAEVGQRPAGRPRGEIDALGAHGGKG